VLQRSGGAGLAEGEPDGATGHQGQETIAQPTNLRGCSSEPTSPPAAGDIANRYVQAGGGSFDETLGTAGHEGFSKTMFDNRRLSDMRRLPTDAGGGQWWWTDELEGPVGHSASAPSEAAAFPPNAGMGRGVSRAA